MLRKEGEGVAEGERSMGGEVLNVLPLLDGAREAFGIGAAVLWFDATEGGIDGGPETEKGSIERDLEEGLTLLVEHYHTVGLTTLNNQSIMAEGTGG
jgi:hypothetical protein